MDTRLNLEQVILGACLLVKTSYTQICDTIKANDFSLPDHIEIYKAFELLNEDKNPIDILTVYQKLSSIGSKVTAVYLSELTGKVGTAENLEYHSRVLKQYSLSQKLTGILNESCLKAIDNSNDVFDTIDEIQTRIHELNLSFVRNKLNDFATLSKSAIDAMSEAKENPSKAKGIMTGIRALDEKLHGLNAPDVTVIAAGVGEGKSTLALQIAHNIAKQKIPVAFFSLEMKGIQLMYKLFSGVAEEQITAIRRGAILPEKMEKIANYIAENNSMPLYVEDNGSLSISDFIATSKYLVSMKGVKVIVLDYVQLMSSGKKFASRELEVSYMTREVKRLAMELNISIIELSQFSRLERGVKRMYAKSDLRESGSIEANADNILAIYRPSEHGVTEIAGLESYYPLKENFAVIQVLKQRLGKIGMFPINFNGAFNRFEEIDNTILNSEDFIPNQIITGHRDSEFVDDTLPF